MKYVQLIKDQARKLGASTDELDLIDHVLYKSGLIFLNPYNKFWEGATFERVEKYKNITRKIFTGGKLNVTALVDEIFEIAQTFSTKELEKYFLESFYEILLKENNNDRSKIELAKFKKAFTDSLKQLNTPGSSFSQISSDEKEKYNKKREFSFLQLFRQNEERMNKFFSLLKSPHLEALDNSYWSYNERKNSIVACFQALKDLDFIHFRSKAELRRVIESKINFEGNPRLFYEKYNMDDYDYFKSKFEKFLS